MLKKLLTIIVLIIVVLLIFYTISNRKYESCKQPNSILLKVGHDNNQDSILIPNLFSSQESQDLITTFKNRYGPAIERHDKREHTAQFQRVIEIPELMSKMEARLQKHVKANDWKIYSKIRVVHYSAGQYKGLHKDDIYKEKIDGKDYKVQYTCLLYLNDDFEGGRTFSYPHAMLTYYDKARLPRESSDSGKAILESEEVETIPQQGLSAIYDINLPHRGEVVKKGEKWLLIFKILLPESPK